jgi:thermitase
MKFASLLIAVLACAAAAVPARADDAAPDALIVKLAPAERTEVRERAGVEAAGRIRGLPGVDVVVPADGDRDRALAELRDDPAVDWAEPVRSRTAFVNDALLTDLWGLDNTGQDIWGVSGTPGADIDATAAWIVTRGAGVTIAVVDTGVASDHPDLAPQLTGGWDYVESDSTPQDPNGHGSHVAGTAAGAAGGGDIVGVAPEAHLLPLRVLDENGDGTTEDVAAAFAAAGEAGVKVVNASLGAVGASDAERLAIHAHPDTLYVVAAGNKNTNAGSTYPCAYEEPNILCVGATNQQDARASFSNYSATVVDLFAPGVDIVSSYPTSRYSHWFGFTGYEMLNGTSMATPHVAGAAALVAAAHPAWSAAQIREALLDTVDALPALDGLAVTGGRLDAAAALGWTPPAPVATPVPDPPAPVAPPASAPAPVATPAPKAPATPAISGLRFIAHPRALSFSVAPAGTVKLVAERRVGRRYKRVGSRTLQVGAGRQRIALRRTLAGARLRAGTWRVTLGTARATFRVG